ncbi:hypothetical protein TSOC_014044, partial [Tetrabaena socialis]
MEEQRPHKRQRTQPQPPSQQRQHQEQQQLGARSDATDEDPSRIWLPEVVHLFAGFLGGNELACTLRLVNKATAAQFRGPEHNTVRLSVLVPHHAFAWRWGGQGATRSLTVQQRKQLPCLTARSGSITNLGILLARDDLTNPLDGVVMEAAASAGQLQVSVKGLLKAAAAGCELPTLQRLHHAYLGSRGRELPPGRGQLLVVGAAAGSSTADWQAKLEWLEGRGYPRSEHACLAAAERTDGRDRLEWLQPRGYPLTTTVAFRAAAHGNADVLEFLMAQHVELSEMSAGHAAALAAEEGHVAALKVLHAHGAFLGRHRMVETAASGGHLPVVAWLVETLGAAAALTADVFAGAVTSGSTELLAWLHQHGCPWDASAFSAAAGWGSEEQLEWLAERGCPMGDDGKPYLHALLNSDLAMLRCLQRLGCPWGPVGRTFTSAVSSFASITPLRRKQRLLALTWLVEQGCPVDWAKAEREAQQVAEECGDFKLLEWVRKQRPPSARATGARLRAAEQDAGSTEAGAG